MEHLSLIELDHIAAGGERTPPQAFNDSQKLDGERRLDDGVRQVTSGTDNYEYIVLCTIDIRRLYLIFLPLHLSGVQCSSDTSLHTRGLTRITKGVAKPVAPRPDNNVTAHFLYHTDYAEETFSCLIAPYPQE